MKPHGEVIGSPANPRVKSAAALHGRRARDRERRMLVEGVVEVRRALAAKVRFETLFVCDELVHKSGGDDVAASASDAGIELVRVTGRVFRKIAYREGAEGIVGVAEQPATSLDRLEPGGLLIVAVGLEKPGNLGAILRTADAAGCSGLILCDRRTDVWNPNVIRASLGTVFTVPIAESGSAAAVEWLKRHHIRIAAAAPAAGCDYTSADLKGPVAFVVGEEHTGLSRQWLDAADVAIRIPMHGAADSLNVSATAAILLYEALRQRG